MTQTLTTKVLNDFITGQGYGVAPSAVEAMARELLANREAQPVAYLKKSIIDSERFDSADPEIILHPNTPEGWLSEYQAVFTAPPAPAVPEESDPRDAFESVFPMPKYVVRCGAGYAVTAYSAWGANDFVERWEGWNACRAAMLAAAPAIYNHWISCSDRMPEEGENIITLNSSGGVFGGYVFKHGVFVDAEEEYRQDDTITHWMPLPAAPEVDKKCVTELHTPMMS